MVNSFESEKSSLLRSTPRLLQILRILARHRFLGAVRGKRHWPPPAEVRKTFEELGLTFIKLGQVLALRRDLLPEAYIQELEQLLDQVPARDFDTVRDRVEQELGAPLPEIFSSFSKTPLAAATIAQVHEATLRDGRHVVVKVRRPDLEEIIATDIAAMRGLVALVEGLFPRLRALDLPVLIGKFADSLSRETDFRREARSIGLSRNALADIPDLWIPEVVAEYSTEAILTMEFAAGERVNLYAKQHPDEMPKVIRTLVRAVLQTIFEEGLFHADPHAGNILVMPDGRLCLLDFGMTGELDEAMRESLTYLLEAVVKGDARNATEAYLEMATASEKVNRSGLLIDMKAVLYDIHGRNLAEVSIGDTFAALLRAGSRHGVHNPGEFFLLTRVFVIMESMMRQLDPKFDFMEAFRDQIIRLKAKHFTPEQMVKRTSHFLRDLERLVEVAPGDMRNVLRHMAEGNLGRMQAPALEALGGRVSRNLKQLTEVIVVGSLLIGGALMVNSPPNTDWHHIFGEAMVGAGVFGIFLVGIRAFRHVPARGGGRR
ncbi:MAG: AarF/UbiB family protein [Desulfuromonadales bacterium]|nr:AarF/UbiB family protein [Desulfuromonadales bacterium]